MIKIFDSLTLDGINNLLIDNEYHITILDQTDSTNNLLKKLAREGKGENTVVIADSQTAGRGRFDRRFHSPKGNGIYMSILLKPDLSPENAVLITAAAAVAVSNAVKKLTGEETQIKWVNDILKKGKKICGILTEGAIDPETGKFDWAVLGIGINAYTPTDGFDKEIQNIAGSVFNAPSIGLRNRLTAEILNQFNSLFKEIKYKTFLSVYRNRSCVLGKEISVIKNGNSISAKALEIDCNCRLLVEYGNGEKEFLNSGEISIKL